MNSRYNEADEINFNVETDKYTHQMTDLVANEQTLTLTPASPLDPTFDGKYKVEISFDDGDMLEHEIDLIVRTAVIAETISEESLNRIMVNSATRPRTTYRCLYKGAAKPVSMTWTKDNVAVDDGTTVVIQDADIQIWQNSKVLLEEGQYKCLVEVAEDSHHPVATVDVFVASVTPEAECVYIDYGTQNDKDITCSYTGSEPATKFLLWKEGEVASEGSLTAHTNNAQVRVTSLMVSISGIS